MDNTPASEADIEQNIGVPCREKGITVYSIGFGSETNAAYMNLFASYTGGAYMYADDPSAGGEVNQLEAFFSGLRAQVLNRYTVKFNAANLTDRVRELKISLGNSANGIDGDTKKYTRGLTDAEKEQEEKEKEELRIEDIKKKKAVYEFDKKMMYKSYNEFSLILKGKGFEAKDGITVIIKGTVTGISCDLRGKYGSDTAINVTVPPAVAVDVYDAYVTIDGAEFVLKNALTICAQGSEKSVNFGPYKFTALAVERNDDNSETTLKGVVVMGGWLRFNGDVTLSGDLERSAEVTLSDEYGCYVTFDKTLGGLPGYAAKKGYVMNLDPLGGVTLYRDVMAKEHNVDSFKLSQMSVANSFIKINNCDVRLYPEKCDFRVPRITFNVPYVDKILLNAGFDAFDADIYIAVSSRMLLLSFDVEYEASDNKITVGNAPLELKEVEIHMNSGSGEYKIELMVGANFLPFEDVGIGFALEWDKDLKLDEAKFYADFEIPANISGVPVTFSKFMLGASDIAANPDKPYKWTLLGGMDISAGDIGAIPVISGIEEYIGDLSLLQIQDAKAEICFAKPRIALSGELYFLEEVKFAGFEIELGCMKFNNNLLGIYGEEMVGIRVKGDVGPEWDKGSTTIILKGTGEFAALNRYFGVYMSGEAELKFDWWIFTGKVDGKAELVLAVRKTQSGDICFVVKSTIKDILLVFPQKYKSEFKF